MASMAAAEQNHCHCQHRQRIERTELPIKVYAAVAEFAESAADSAIKIMQWKLKMLMIAAAAAATNHLNLF
jgi:hypothetical protein